MYTVDSTDAVVLSEDYKLWLVQNIKTQLGITFRDDIKFRPTSEDACLLCRYLLKHYKTVEYVSSRAEKVDTIQKNAVAFFLTSLRNKKDSRYPLALDSFKKLSTKVFWYWFPELMLVQPVQLFNEMYEIWFSSREQRIKAVTELLELYKKRVDYESVYKQTKADTA